MYPQSYIRVVRVENCVAEPSFEFSSKLNPLSFDNVSYFIELPSFPSPCLRWNRFFAGGNIRYLDTAKGDHWRADRPNLRL